MVVLVADEDALACAAHAMLVVVFLETLEAREHRGVFFGLVLFRAEGVVAEREEADAGGLIGGERFWEDGPSEGGSVGGQEKEGRDARV